MAASEGRDIVDGACSISSDGRIVVERLCDFVVIRVSHDDGTTVVSLMVRIDGLLYDLGLTPDQVRLAADSMEQNAGGYASDHGEGIVR